MVVESEKAAVADRYPMGITGQIRQHGLGTGERPLAVDDPIDLAQRFEPVGEGGDIGQRVKVAVALQFTLVIGGLELFQKQASEQA